jgi:hypothetical protein
MLRLEEPNLCDCTGTHLDEADGDRAVLEVLLPAFVGVHAGYFLLACWFVVSSFGQWPLGDAIA